MAYKAWFCETCGEASRFVKPWACLGCSKEICECCFYVLGHCKGCVMKSTEEEMAKKYEEVFG